MRRILITAILIAIVLWRAPSRAIASYPEMTWGFFQSAFDDPTVGDSPWSSPSSATACDGQWTFAAPHNNSHYLRLSDANLGAPPHAKILGIDVALTARAIGNGPSFVNVRLFKDGAPAGDTHQFSPLPNTASVYTLGNSADLWGFPWLADDVNRNDFGLAVSTDSTTPDTIGVDCASVTVYYLSNLLFLPLLTRP